jgi:hypothetical protein
VVTRPIALLVVMGLALSTFADPSEAEASEPLSPVDARELAEQLLATMHHHARSDPAGWSVREDPAPVIPAWSDLRAAARWWSAAQAGGICGERSICHNVPPMGPGFSDEMCCASAAGENVASTYEDTPAGPSIDLIDRMVHRLMAGWMASDGHRGNIMSSRWDDFAVGVEVTFHRVPSGTRITITATSLFRTRTATPAGHRYDELGERYRLGLVGHAAERIRDPALDRPHTQPRLLDAACPARLFPGDRFVDVAQGSGPARAIDCLAGWAIAKGTADGRYEPQAVVRRDQAASFLHRLLHLLDDAVPPAEPSRRFADLHRSSHGEAIEHLAQLGLINGRSAQRFAPSEPVTRGQMAALLARVLGHVDAAYLSGDEPDYFVDDEGLVHEDALNTLADLGIVTGVTRGRVAPAGHLTRAHLAQYLARTLDIVVDDGIVALPR